MGQVISSISQDGDGRTIFDNGRRRTLADGLVFTPASVPYFRYMVHKLKPTPLLTVDFIASAADIRDADGQVSGSAILMVAQSSPVADIPNS